MVIKELQSQQASELQKKLLHIVNSVADRKWNRETLATNLDSLYLMGVRHGCEMGEVVRLTGKNRILTSE